MPGQPVHKRICKILRSALLPVLGLLLAVQVQAVPPRTFSADYNASYEGIRASATRSLAFDPGTGRYSLHSMVELTLFGSSLTRIDERSDFLWVDEKPLPQHYEFIQTGFGARKRTVDFDHANQTADFTINDDVGKLMLAGPAFDDLSGYLVAKEQLARGATEVRFDVVDRGEIREHHYKMVNRVMLETPLGRIKAVHLVRVREDNARKTEIWLAPDHDYLLLKLVQTEPDGSTIELNVRSATLGEHELSAATLDAAASSANVTPNAAPAP